ncbi:hypothetical protein QTP88_008984 [Uroleucon formosanum]
MDRSVKTVYLFSDNCSAQNKNFALTQFLYTITTNKIYRITKINCNIGLLKSELIDLQQDIKGIFNGKNNTMEFLNTLEEHQYLSLLSNVKDILTFFGPTYLCEAAFSKKQKGTVHQHQNNIKSN